MWFLLEHGSQFTDLTTRRQNQLNLLFSHRLIPLWLDWSKKHESFYWKSTINLIHLCKDIWDNPEYNQGLIKSHKEILCPNHHPNELGHRWVADKIISLINFDK